MSARLHMTDAARQRAVAEDDGLHLHTMLDRRVTLDGRVEFVGIVTERRATPRSNTPEDIKRIVGIGTAFDLLTLNAKLAARGYPTLEVRHG